MFSLPSAQESEGRPGQPALTMRRQATADRRFGVLVTLIGISYRSIDLDSAAYQKDNRGGAIRVALRQKTGSPTIPQIFVGGEHIGGCAETFDAFNAGHLQELLERSGVAFDRQKKADAYSFLPKWLHPR